MSGRNIMEEKRELSNGKLRSIGIQAAQSTRQGSGLTLGFLSLSTIGTTIVYNWKHHHFLYQSKVYFAEILCKTILTTACLYFLMILRGQRPSWSLM